MSEETKSGIVLPTAPRPATAVNAENMCIYGKPKSGKTTALSELKNCLLIDLERGASYVDAMVMSVPENVGPVAIRNWIREVAKSIREAGRPYDYVAIDTLSQIDIWSEWWGTWDYMHSVAGKKFNKQLDDRGELILGPDKKPILLKPSDPAYESVLSLSHGYGYQHTRQAFLEIFELLKNLGKVSTIFVCHVADKMIAEKNGEQVMTKDLALTGKLQSIIPRVVDAIANVWNEDGQMMISFEANEEKIGGVRAKHLRGYNGPLDWNKIFIK